MRFKEYNDVLPSIQHEWFKEQLESLDFMWAFNQDSTYTGREAEGLSSRHPSFSSLIFESEHNYCNQHSFKKFELILLTLLHAAKLNSQRLQRVRLGLYLPIKTDTEYNNIHTDRRNKHTVLLYYVNDNDGDTYWFDENDNIIHKVTPKANTAIVFDGSIRHASSNPSVGFKISLNLNIDES